MNVTEAIYGRRAVREFTAEPVDETILRQLIDAAIQAAGDARVRAAAPGAADVGDGRATETRAKGIRRIEGSLNAATSPCSIGDT